MLILMDPPAVLKQRRRVWCTGAPRHCEVELDVGHEVVLVGGRTGGDLLQCKHEHKHCPVSIFQSSLRKLWMCCARLMFLSLLCKLNVLELEGGQQKSPLCRLEPYLSGYGAEGVK